MQRIAVLFLFMVFSQAVGAQDPTRRLATPEVAAKIDDYIESAGKAKGGVFAPVADDAEFVRRIHLDIVGRIPDITTTRDFIENPAKDKRPQTIDDLFDSERYSLHWANVWRRWLVGDNQEEIYNQVGPMIESWLRGQLKSNERYDKLVRSLVTAGQGFGNGPSLFLQANQYKAEVMASSVTRIFLGVKLECAQCHDHPHAKWSRKQFWETAAFFTEVTNPYMVDENGKRVGVKTKPGEIRMPGSDKVLSARFLDGTPVSAKNTFRNSLADWITAKENPYFARAAVNRVWEYLMGVGLVDPLDEESAENPPSHPELLTFLAAQFTAHDFDLRYLIKAITMSRAYQRTSRQTHASQLDPRLFARMRVRGVSPEQLFDSLTVATGGREEVPIYDPRFGGFNPASSRADFIRRFPAPEKRAEQQTSILQALYLMNGKIVSDATSLEYNRNLAILANGTSVPTARRAEQLFLITLNRKPSARERDHIVRYVDSGGPRKDSARAMCDVFWALLNSSEFCVNH